MATNDELYLTPYQQIMAQMTPTTNPYLGANVAIGGYDPALFRRMSGLGLINLGVGGGGSGGSEPAPPSAWSSMTPAQQAAYYAANPTMAGITQLGQKGFGFTSLGMLQNLFNPGLISEQGLIAMGIDPAAYQSARESFRASEIADMNGGFPGYASSYESGVGNPGESYSGGYTSSDTGVGNPGESYSGGYTSSDTGVGNPGESYSGGYTSSDTGVGNPGESDSDGDGWAKGGKVTKGRLKGPDPKGPDEGYGALLGGEYVIKKSAVNKYGTGLLDMINAGKIPAKKMKSLLG